VISQYQEYKAGRGTANSEAYLGRKVITVFYTGGCWRDGCSIARTVMTLTAAEEWDSQIVRLL
jgi:hypothetical protein